MKDDRAKWTRFRLWMVMAVFIAAFGCVLWRAFDLQVVNRDRLAKIAEAECSTTVRLNPVRGEIYDRNGEKMAVSLEADSVFVDPAKVEDKSATASALAKVLGMKKRTLIKKLSAQNSFMFIKRQVSPKEADEVAALNLKGVGMTKESRRFYPNKFLAAHLLGFVGVDSNGLEGLEVKYDKYLRGGSEVRQVRHDALGRTYLDLVEAEPESTKGATVTLTLDRRIQYVTEKVLAKAVEEHGAKGGLAMVVRPQTGEILASAVVPAFNPNVFSRYSAARRRNRVVTDTFDPGSTFKVFVVAAALEEGAVTLDEQVDCEKGSLKIGAHTIHDTRPHGKLTVSRIVKVSSNIGAAKIGARMGPEIMHDYLNRFSFGVRTGVDFPGESPGLLRPAKKWRKLDLANVAFGQGLTVTALQLTMAMSALANDGLLMKPYVVSEIRDASGNIIKRVQPEIVRQAVSAETAASVRKMLRMVVTPGGTGTMAEPDGYPAAGKTGTAQKLDLKERRYSDRKYFSSFLGFVPYDNPKLTILVALDEPWPKIYGGHVAGPAFKEIAEQVLPMLNVTPSPPPVIPGDGPEEEPVKVIQARKKKEPVQKVVVKNEKKEPRVEARSETRETPQIETGVGPGVEPRQTVKVMPTIPTGVSESEFIKSDM